MRSVGFALPVLNTIPRKFEDQGLKTTVKITIPV